ncbi:hypothetical protein B0H16DRAFT_1467641 [Mycena metata]|uniref:Uncharacterized protein n=1 Tax=Mycena metata TaxID=1033252 RepID=A0AAD7MVN7_9AGAR|nr:hypothetical protein B0H16DRAFT_1467641 [Mycena metata]
MCRVSRAQNVELYVWPLERLGLGGQVLEVCSSQVSMEKAGGGQGTHHHPRFWGRRTAECLLGHRIGSRRVLAEEDPLDAMWRCRPAVLKVALKRTFPASAWVHGGRTTLSELQREPSPGTILFSYCILSLCEARLRGSDRERRVPFAQLLNAQLEENLTGTTVLVHNGFPPNRLGIWGCKNRKNRTGREASERVDEGPCKRSSLRYRNLLVTKQRKNHYLKEARESRWKWWGQHLRFL